MSEFWQPGHVIQWTYRRPGWKPGDPQGIYPMRVVQDDAAGLVAWLAGNTPALVALLADGSSIGHGAARTMFTAPRIQGRGVWHGTGTLRIVPTGKPWSVWLFRNDVGELTSYYVNLEDPHRREGDSTITSDHVLDVVVDPDGKHRRKDEDELVEAVRQGRYTPEQAAAIERDADAVEAIIDEWGSPFCDGWEAWRPDPTWPIPPKPMLPS